MSTLTLPLLFGNDVLNYSQDVRVDHKGGRGGVEIESLSHHCPEESAANTNGFMSWPPPTTAFSLRKVRLVTGRSAYLTLCSLTAPPGSKRTKWIVESWPAHGKTCDTNKGRKTKKSATTSLAQHMLVFRASYSREISADDRSFLDDVCMLCTRKDNGSNLRSSRSPVVFVIHGAESLTCPEQQARRGLKKRNQSHVCRGSVDSSVNITQRMRGSVRPSVRRGETVYRKLYMHSRAHV